MGFFKIRSLAKYQKIGRTLWGHLKNSEKKFHKAEKSLTKPKSLIVPKKVRTFCFGILVKKLAHTHGFEHETSGLKSKHLTTRPRTRETCELPREIRELSHGKKHPHFSITLAYRNCKDNGNFHDLKEDILLRQLVPILRRFDMVQVVKLRKIGKNHKNFRKNRVFEANKIAQAENFRNLLTRPERAFSCGAVFKILNCLGEIGLEKNIRNFY